MDQIDTTVPGLYRDHLAALDVLRHAKNIFFWLAVVAIALHVVSWAIVCCTDTLDPLGPITRGGGDPVYGAEASPGVDRHDAARQWERTLESALALGGFVGRVSVLVLNGVFLIGLLISLSGGLGGAAALAKACVWSLVALAMLVPWLRAPESVALMASALYGLDELTRSTVGIGAPNTPMAVVRFLICPVLVAAFLLAAQAGFRKAYGQITAVPGSKLPIHEV